MNKTDLLECPHCEATDIRTHSRNPSRWRCKECGRTFSEYYKRHGVFSGKTRCIGDRPMSGAERKRKCRAEKKESNQQEEGV